MTMLPDTVIDEAKLKDPDILLKLDPVWQETCRNKVARIPSGYTYLTQLVGHDMGLSLDTSLVPHVARTDKVDGNGPDAPKSPRVTPKDAAGRLNLITNPLTLETISAPARAYWAIFTIRKRCYSGLTQPPGLHGFCRPGPTATGRSGHYMMNATAIR